MANNWRACAGRQCLLPFIAFLSTVSLPNVASAEKTLAKGEDWELYTDGRAGGFVSWVHGDGLPADTYVNDFNGNAVPLFSVSGGGFSSSHEQGPIDDPSLNFPPNQQRPPNAGTINMFRVRSGFIDNIIGLGARYKLDASTTVSAYIQLWMFVESEGRQKNRPNFADARQGYAKIEGPWGNLIVGRTRALFSRGATDIDVLYAHRWGVGWPGSIDSNGPTLGQIGFGVLGSGFSSAIIYGTPVLGGLQLNIGAFDPIQLQGNGGWNRTTLLRPEAELTFEQKFGDLKVVLFANGAYQKVYKEGYCRTTLFPSEPPGTVLPPCDATAAGFGYGGRFELGPVHLGIAGHYGKGLGFNYALEVSDAAEDKQGNLRTFDGYYAQLQVVLGSVDLFTGAGISRAFLTDSDKTIKKPDPRDPLSADPATAAMAAQVFPFSVIKYQLGVNGGIVYHATPSLHFDLDFFRAQAGWFDVNGFPGATQVVYVANGGMMVSW
jgi:hypothetical protein